MKKIILMLCILFLVSCNTPTITFTQADMSGYSELTNDHFFQPSSMKALFQAVEEEKNGIYYIGYVDCPWCQAAAPILDEAAKEANMPISYIELFDQNKTITITEEEKNRFLNWATNHLERDQSGNITLYVPYVFILKEGEIVDYHIGTFDEHNANERDMSEEEKKELKNIYIDMMNKI